MHAPKHFALGVTILCLAGFFARNHYRRWRDHFSDCVEDYLTLWSRGVVLPLVIIAFLFLWGGAEISASFVPDGRIYFSFDWPFVYVTSEPQR